MTIPPDKNSTANDLVCSISIDGNQFRIAHSRDFYVTVEDGWLHIRQKGRTPGMWDFAQRVALDTLKAGLRKNLEQISKGQSLRREQRP
jgi:hypothetical protein